MNGKLKIALLARQTGLSISTVSRVLAGKSNTSLSAREKVIACARQHGILQELSQGRLMLNNLVIFAPPRAFSSRTDIFYYKVIQSVIEAVKPYDVRISSCGLAEELSDSALFVEKMNHPQTQASLIIGIDDPHIHSLAVDLNKPCVLINCSDRNMRLDSVSPDHQLIGEFSASYLLQQGHREILNLQCLRRTTMEQRLAGIRQAWLRHNLTFDAGQHLVTTAGFCAEEAELAVGTWLDALPDRRRWPSAILAGGDFMAMGAVAAIKKRGLSVPDDISVMSTDSSNLAEIYDVPLTSVQVPRDELGYEAIQMLQRRLLRPAAAPCHLLLQGKLAVRESVRRLTLPKMTPALSTHHPHLYDN
jgi:DNA-binding LacI/PurR family transcriptional regulator